MTAKGKEAIQKHIIHVLGQYGNGTTIGEVHSALSTTIQLRTLQRYLRELVEEGSVVTSGAGRSLRYHFSGTAVADSSRYDPDMELIPLSGNAKDILALVTRPVQQRHPVGFERIFLEQYKPNKSSFLSKEEMNALEQLGKISGIDQPAGTYAKDVMNRLLIDLSWNSSRLEGNTYSLLDTERLIAFGEATDNKSAAEAQMILNHKDAIEFIVRDPKDIGFNRYTLLNLHALLSHNLLSNPAAEGRLRSIEVGISQSVYTPIAIPQLIEEMFELILAKAEQIKNPFEQALFIMVYLPYLQPFDDVNKRVSRLAANIPFARHNLAPLSFVDVPDDLYVQGVKGVYELRRIDLLKDLFIWAYKRSAARYAVIRHSLGEPDPFKLKYREEIKAMINSVVLNTLSRKAASVAIEKGALKLPQQDQHKYVEVVETELMNLHEGNFARFYISPTEFGIWKKAWDENRS